MKFFLAPAAVILTAIALSTLKSLVQNTRLGAWIQERINGILQG